VFDNEIASAPEGSWKRLAWLALDQAFQWMLLAMFLVFVYGPLMFLFGYLVGSTK
jgi:hypothetical protein